MAEQQIHSPSAQDGIVKEASGEFVRKASLILKDWFASALVCLPLLGQAHLQRQAAVIILCASTREPDAEP